MSSPVSDVAKLIPNQLNKSMSRKDYQAIPDADEFGGPANPLLDNRSALSSQKQRWLWKKLCLLTIPLTITIIYIYIIAQIGSIRPGEAPYLSNGTHQFKPTTILISIDGFRADYLERGLTPNLKRIIDAGSRAKFMVPSFPTITFPNHYALATGLFPDSHGIVGNTFYDPLLNKTFSYREHSSNLEPEWWGGEPIWTSTELQGQISAVHMWPGSEVPHKNVMSSYLQPFVQEFELEDKASQLLGWLDLPTAERPTFLGAYIPDVDTAGHDFGPNSNETRAAIFKVDHALGLLLDGLNNRNLSNIVNLIVVSDHGMAEVVSDRVIHLDDYINMNLIASHHIFPYAGLTPNKERDIDFIYRQLKNASHSQNWNVYKKQDVPEHFHYGHNARVPPIFCIQESGWAFGTRKAYPQFEQYSDVRGLHGFDNRHPDMRAVFIAKGPAFRRGVMLEPFQNVEVYNLLCHLLGLNPAVNNGTRTFWNDKLVIP